VTFLFTDIEDSTSLWAEQPVGMGASLRLHDDVVRSLVAERDGHVFAVSGDGFGVAFARASDALATAQAVQERLTALDWPGPRLRVRMGVHLGEAEERGGNYFGPAVNIAARVMGAAYGGQLLATGLVVTAAGASGGARNLGAVRLRGVPEPVEVFQVGPGDFPPLRSQGVGGPGALPLFRTSLVGRDTEVAEVAGLLAQHNVVTVTGSGGAGKTRLAVEVASTSTQAFPGGVWFVDLSRVEDGSGVAGALTQAMDLAPVSGVASVGQIVSYLCDREGLLVLDSCEHLAEVAAGVVDAVVTGAPGVRVLATSREVLGVEGEVVWRIPPLPTGPGSVADALFLERATAVGWSGEEGHEVVAEICERLDGIPLAIELAAARARSMPLPEIRDRLDDRFRLLSGGPYRSHRRQQTLEATVWWSYDLLEPDEQKFLHVLGVFLGGFRADDAAAVAGLDEWVVFDLLDSLVAKSMVHPDVGGTVARYRLLETVRLFALERLVEDGDARDVRDAHLERFVHAAVTLPFLLVAPHQRATADYDNVLSAGQWAMKSGRHADAARLAIMAQECLNARGALDTALAWLHCDAGLGEAERVRCLALLAHLSWYRLDGASVARHSIAAIDAAAGRPFDGLPLAYLTRTYAAALEQDFGRIEPSLAAAEDAARDLPDPNPSLALVALLRAAWAEAWGDFEGAVGHARRSIALAPELYARSLVEAHLVVSLLALGRTDEAGAALAAAVVPPSSSPHRHLTDITRMLVEGTDDPFGAQARGALLAAEQTRRQPHTVGDWLVGFGWLAHRRGDRDLALEIGRDTASLFLPNSSLVAAVEGWDPAQGWPLLEQYWAPLPPMPDRLARTMELFEREIAQWR
jgi:predicted ATPase